MPLFNVHIMPSRQRNKIHHAPYPSRTTSSSQMARTLSYNRTYLDIKPMQRQCYYTNTNHHLKPPTTEPLRRNQQTGKEKYTYVASICFRCGTASFTLFRYET